MTVVADASLVVEVYLAPNLRRASMSFTKMVYKVAGFGGFAPPHADAIVADADAGLSIRGEIIF